MLGGEKPEAYIVDRLLTLGPIASLFGKMELNMSDAIDRAREFAAVG